MASRRTRSASPRLSGGERVRRRSPLAAEDTGMDDGDGVAAGNAEQGMCTSLNA